MSGTEHTENSDFGYSERIDTIEPRLGMSDVPLFTSLLQKIDACYTRVDDVMNGCNLATMDTEETNSTHWRNDNGELEYHQKLQKFVLPYDLEKAVHVVWKSNELPQHQRDRQVYDGFGNPGNTLAIRYRLVRTLTTGTFVSVVQRLAVRRFFEQDRVVSVWKVFTEGEGIFRGMHSTLTGWGTMRSLLDGSGILCEVCIRQFPSLVNVTPSVSKEFHQFLQVTLDEDKRSVMTTIQDRLSIEKREPFL
ncbi:hypothetical protein GN244_ATG09098 [Phytophthora infestans]|uniref:M96 mating-specific protein family n=1 Tax=Phytophthora infestans TaxID=4787 RepID=A0A833WDZ7_PHYIN|nr:hypothetical protein GN244_ATG09098 [Phytophthora infestans]